MNTELYGITGPTFTATLEIKDGKVFKTTPVLTHMKGWALEEVKDFCKKRNFKIIDMTPNPQPPRRVA